DELPDRWGELSSIFSKDAVLKGSFDKYAESNKTKRGTLEFDARFLREIESWRTMLAETVAKHNRRLSVAEVNFVVQQTVDRIVFLRICEDRGIELYGRLKPLQEGRDVYARLKLLYADADNKYNSGLFHFRKEQGRRPPDSLTLGVDIDDRTLRHIFRQLYYPESSYAFSVVSSDILGQVYEQFLGKVIQIAPTGKAEVALKPEVRKAGGVFYTPTYVVKYIVANALGPLVEGRSLKEVERIHVVDPACGSGSFLLEAYQYLLDWHLNYYLQDPEKHVRKKRPPIRLVRDSQWRLATDERKRILLTSIFGVDIDTQAVEVTKLSLLLKVLEGENKDSIDNELKLLHARALPDLEANIRCGNSLIDSSIRQVARRATADQIATINPFDWKSDFPDIFAKGGFSAVIGNPPYIQLSMADYYSEPVSDYLAIRYDTTSGRMNTFGFFIMRAIDNLLAPDGYLGYIVPNTVLTQDYYEQLRIYLLDCVVERIETYRYPVFENAVVETVSFVVKNRRPVENVVTVDALDNRAGRRNTHTIAQTEFTKAPKHAFIVLADDQKLAFRKKLDSAGPPLGTLANLNQAIALKHDRKLSLSKGAKAPNYKRVLDGRDIGRYALAWPGNYLAYDVNNIHSCKRTDIFEAREKLFFRRVGDRLTATYDSEQFYALNTLVVITPKNLTQPVNLKYLLALINSRLLNFYYTIYIKSTKRIFSEIQARQLARIPIRQIDHSNFEDTNAEAELIYLVDEMLDAERKAAAARVPHEKTLAARRIRDAETRIDKLIYNLYDLTTDDIGLVEGEESEPRPRRAQMHD
ncbi:MAG: Eco57I restriction-modification methylase domain-containing protein, partial [Vulcanimicrobiaceae bacterium]